MFSTNWRRASGKHFTRPEQPHPDTLHWNSEISEPVNGDAFRGLCNHVFWSNAAPAENPAFGHGDIVFCKIDETWRFFRALRRTRKRVILVTGEGSKAVTRALLRHKPGHVAAWFGTNMDTEPGRRDCRALPLGLGNAGAARTPAWREIQEVCAKPACREGLLYANFEPHTNPAVRGPLWDWARQPEQSWITCSDHSPTTRGRYLEELRSHHFVLCPPGTGEDTHRFWEALYCGAIPVVRRSAALQHFDTLPVLAVDNFTDLHPDSLHRFLDEVRQRSFDNDVMELGFWRRELAAEKARLADSGPLSWSQWMRAWWVEICLLLAK